MNGTQPFGGTGNIDQFTLNQFRNQNTFNSNHSNMLPTNRMNNIHNNSNGNTNHIATPFGLQINGSHQNPNQNQNQNQNNTNTNANNHTNTNTNANIRNNGPSPQLLQQQTQQTQQNNTNHALSLNNLNNNNNNNINNTHSITANTNNTNNLFDTLMNQNNNNNNNNSQNHNNTNNNSVNNGSNTQNHNGFSMNNIDNSQIPNPLNSAMSSADVETILHLQKQTDDFHQHLSNFINTHLPELPDTMQLMDQLSYDFTQNSNNTTDINMNDKGGANNNNNNNNNSLPTLEEQNNTDEKANNNNTSNDINSTSDLSQMRQQVAALRVSCESYKKQFEVANRDVLTWKQECIKLRNENGKLKNRVSMMENQLIGTRNVAINGGGPRLDNLEFVKQEDADTNINYRRTKGVDMLKELVRKQYDNSKWKIEGDEDLYDTFDHILGFLNENDENMVTPLVLVARDRVPNNEMNIDGNGTDNDENENYMCIPQEKVIEKYKIRSHPRVAVLNGQFGIRAKMDIPQNTVIGQYIGIEYLETEFHSAYQGTQENALKNVYAFTLTIGGDKNQKGKNNQNENNQTAGHNNSELYGNIVIDAHGFEIDKENKLKPLLIYINDCRKDISLEKKTSDDEKEENCQFAKVSLNGWPSIFVITKCNIRKGEELLVFYGKDYYHALKEKELQQQIRNRNQNIIDRNIIQGQINVNNRHVNLV